MALHRITNSFFVIISSLLLLIFFIPFIHSLSTFAISESSSSSSTSTQTLVCALIYNETNQPFSLNCSSFHLGTRTPLIFNSNISFSSIVAGDGFFCGLKSFPSSNTSTLHCWRFTNATAVSSKRIYNGPSISNLEAGTDHICGLVEVTNQLACWRWRNFSPRGVRNYTSISVGEDFGCGLSNSGKIGCFGESNSNTSLVYTNVPAGGNYSVIAAGFRHACAINQEGDLFCWGNINVVGNPPKGEFKGVALGESRSCALRVNGTVVCWGEDGFDLPENLRGEYFSSIEAKSSVFCGVLAENNSLYCWGNADMNSNLTMFDNVLQGPCTSTCPCKIVPHSADICGTSGVICEPCVFPNSTVTSSALPMSPPPPSECQKGGTKWNWRMVTFLVVGCVGSLSIILIIGYFVMRSCKSRPGRVHDSGRLDESGPPSQHQAPQVQPQRPAQGPVLEKRLSQLASMGNAGRLEEFKLQVLRQVTQNFSEDHKIGSGSFGSIYCATLEDGREVAIKRAEVTSSSSLYTNKHQEDKDNAFVNELESLSRVNHKNLVPLLGFCEDSDELILVYQYMSNGTLLDHLHKLDESPINSWPARIRIALDAARGIEYLHEYAVPQIIHRDIKSSNILLNSEWTAKVSDFGLSLMGPGDDESHLSLLPAGTVGYMDPEYYKFQQLTTKSDVYSFGVVLLELLSGYKAIHRNENGVPRNVVDFVVPYIIADEIHRVLDLKLPPPTPFEIEAVAYVGYLAADCVAREGRNRPSMTEIVNSLERAFAACFLHPSLSPSVTSGSSTP